MEQASNKQYVLAIDQGTSSSRAILFDHENRVVAMDQKEIQQIYRHPGWVEEDANEIWMSVLNVMNTCVQKAGIQPQQVCAIGISNQRETTVVWDKNTGLPIASAIVWQSRQTTPICDSLQEKHLDNLIHEKTGLRIDPYFSASKIRFLLDQEPGAQEKAEKGEYLAGTIDSWLVWKLTGQKAHITDYSNASRTLLFNIYEKKWDQKLCDLFSIPMGMLPEVKDSSCIYGTTAPYHFFGCSIPIAAVAGDQQASLFGQQCFETGDVKNTYGTGAFLLMNTGEKAVSSKNGLLTTIAWGYQGKCTYALEGSVFVAGSAVQWLRDALKFFSTSSDSEGFAKLSNRESQVMVVPSFTGLGTPYWDSDCKGAIFGITRDTSKEDITRATLDGIAYQSYDVCKAMEQDSNISLHKLRVDGGASANGYLMQKQSDVLQCDVERPKNVETTALGAAHLAGLAVGYWKDFDDCKLLDQDMTIFKAKKTQEQVQKQLDSWSRAVQAARLFSKENPDESR